MHHRFFVLTVSGFISLFGMPLSAMTLSEAFELATQHDPAIPQSIAIYEAERTLSHQTTGERLPSANATGQIATGRSRVKASFLPDGEEDGTQITGRVELRQPLYRRNWRALGRLGEALDAQAELGREDRIQRMISRVAERYFAVLQKLEALDVARSESEALSKALEDTANRHQAGLVAVTDLQEAQARHDLARAGLRRAEAALDSARDALHEISNNGYARMPRLRHQVSMPQLIPDSAEGWVKVAMENSLVLLRSAENLLAAEAQLVNSRSAYSPIVDIVAAYNYDDTSDFPDGQQRRDASIGVELQVPLYNGGMIRARSREARYRLEAARSELSRLKLETERRIRQLYRDVEVDRGQIEALQQAVVSAETARQATENGYQAGTRTILDLLDAEARLAEARHNLSDARFGFLFSLIELRYEAGVLEADDIRNMDVLLQYQ